MTTYNIKYTDINTNPIQISEGSIDSSSTDITLFGRIRLEYGEQLNENFLHLLENFACPQDAAAYLLDQTVTPDLTIAISNALIHPTEGQVWFNKTDNTPYLFSGLKWNPLSQETDCASNWGKIYHNQQLPLPVSSSGYEFSYDECVWMVSPSGNATQYEYMVCTTTDDGKVIHQYSLLSTGQVIDGIANYLIIGVKGNSKTGSVLDVPSAPPIASPTPSTSRSPTPTPSAMASPTPTPTVTPTKTSSPTPTVTPTRTTTPTPTVTPSSSRPPIQGTLYINPSVGFYNKFNLGSTCGTHSFDSILTPSFDCTDTAYLEPEAGRLSNGACYPDKRLEVWLLDLTGGNGGPYTIKWNLTFFYSVWSAQASTYAPNSCADTIPNIFPNSGFSWNGTSSGYTVTVGETQYGINGGISTYANIDEKQMAYVRSVIHGRGSGYTYFVSISILNGSSVTLSDSSGNSITYYTPSGSGGSVLGTQLLTPPGSNYGDSYNKG